MKQIYFPIIAFLMCMGYSNAQNQQQIAKIRAKSNMVQLRALQKEKNKDYQNLELKAQENNIPMVVKTGNQSVSVLQYFDEQGRPVYFTDDNVNAARTTRTNFINSGGGLGLQLDGQGMTVGVWEVGSPRLTHQEFDGPGGTDRVTQQDTFNYSSYHANHVMGTIAAAGIDPSAKGMAPYAHIDAYTSSNDIAEAAQAAANGLLISNHSYGRNTIDFVVPAELFGQYNTRAFEWDEVLYNAPYYLSVKSAQNDGNRDDINSMPLNGNSEYDKLLNEAVSKNNLVVAAFADISVDSLGNPTSLIRRATFSSEGPTDDLRIKPDIGGNGLSVYSALDFSDSAYGLKSGTSMAAPNVAGSLILLQQHYQNLNNSFMRAATLKGLALHTADDVAGPGPDATTGWGLLNSKKAAETITASGSTAVINEIELYNGQSYTITVASNDIDKLIASISWTDVPGPTQNDVNSSTPVLVNDLDIRVSQNGTEYLPWKLTSITSNDRGDNTVDNYERVDVDNASGIYTITINHKGSIQNNIQNFSLIITGIQSVISVDDIPQVTRTEFPYYERFEQESVLPWSVGGIGNVVEWKHSEEVTNAGVVLPMQAEQGDGFLVVPDENVYGWSHEAHLFTPILDMGSERLGNITFSYNMAGPNGKGYLKLEMRLSDDFWQPIWSSFGSSGWETASVDFQKPFFRRDMELRFVYSRNRFDVGAVVGLDNVVINIGAATIPEPDGYCEIGLAEPDNTFEWIQQVSFIDILNDSGPSENYSGYSNFTDFQSMFTEIGPLETRSVAIQPGWSGQRFPEDYAVYIDYNRDGDFDDPGELVYERSFSESTRVIGTFNIPQQIGYGRTRMRVIMHYDIINGPCSRVEYGEVEDYAVVLLGDPNFNAAQPKDAIADQRTSEIQQQIVLYPNPAVDNINIVTDNLKINSLSIYDTTGQTVFEGKFSKQIDISTLATGVYLIRLEMDGETVVKRFVKK
ncbi:S8 family serine peptidase [Nonlabens xiamenensis]|uniref:S8 family serine peptidase n=1 Tax=Nonlabens xiamenensis TaxID=2341043 RepID=UPI000F60C5B6|nr:S8 family serine peptidase [Nonlabens xiamenensis]